MFLAIGNWIVFLSMLLGAILLGSFVIFSTAVMAQYFVGCAVDRIVDWFERRRR